MQINFGGLYFGTEDKATGRYTEYGGTTGKLDPKLPWTNVKVRQAMNKAINRKELLKVLYKGRASPMYVHGFYPDLEGWDPTWEKRFPEMYGYRPGGGETAARGGGVSQGLQGQGLALSLRRRAGNDRGDGSGGPSVARGGHRDRAGRGRLGGGRAPQVAEARSQWVPLGDPALEKGGRAAARRLQRRQGHRAHLPDR